MAATYETNVNNNNNNIYDEDNSSELSKENYSSSASSFVDETKKISFEDKKEEKNLSSSKRNKRNSFISRLNPRKNDKEKEEKEKHSEGLVRSISGIFGNKDKDNKDKDNSHKRESEKQLRPTSRTSSHSDTSRNRRSFIFFSDDEEQHDDTITTKKGRKSRQSSNAEGLEKDKSSKKGNRLSVNLGKFFEKSEKSSSQKSKDGWDDIFLEPDGTKITPKSPKSSSSHSSLKDKHDDDDLTNEYVESPQIIQRDNSIIGTKTDNNVNFPTKLNQNVINTNGNPVDDVHSTFSSTQPSSVDDHYNNQEISSNNNIINNKHETEYNSGSPTSPTTPITPKLIVTPIEPESEFTAEITNKSNVQEFEEVRQEEQDEKEDKIDQNNTINSIVELKSHKSPVTSTNNVKLNVITDFRERKNDDTFTNFIEQQQQQQQGGYDTKTELEEINKSLNNVKEQLEAKVAEQNSQISKSMEQIMQQQIDLSKRMSETMQRLESKANNNVQKDELDTTSVGKIFEDTIKRLESKIDKQNDELNRLKSVVGQLGQLNGENQPFLVTSGDISRLRITQGEDQNLIIAQQGEGRALIQTQSPHMYSKSTLVSTLVVNPICNTITVSASIATSVLYAVYVRPVVGLVGVLRNGISTNCETKE